MIPQPLIATDDVVATSQWYQIVLGLQSGHGGDEYERLLHNGQLVLQLHRWDVHDHAYMGEPSVLPYGNGVLLWFQTNDFDQALGRIVHHQAEIVDGPLVNPNAHHREVWVKDPNGYVVVVAGAYGDLGET